MANVREAVIMPPELLALFMSTPLDTQVKIFVDIKNSAEIMRILNDNMKKMRRVIIAMFNAPPYNNDLYGKETVSNKSENITAIKFKGKLNIRIYCKEYAQSDKDKIIVLAYPYYKKSEKIDKKTKNIIETAPKYEYNFGEHR
ncbi:MAG TPA: hypothetical protein PK239_00985 [Chitinophagales bacterium]|nr:hypothetical protein [Chitinophagales bacterium]HRK25838.1 hypothetical protein [Chitinophagales bacterium]